MEKAEYTIDERDLLIDRTLVLMELIQGKCKNCGDSVISQDHGISWVHGIIVQNRPWLTPINSLCNNPKGRVIKEPDDDFIPDNWEEVLYLSE